MRDDFSVPKGQSSAILQAYLMRDTPGILSIDGICSDLASSCEIEMFSTRPHFGYKKQIYNLSLSCYFYRHATRREDDSKKHKRVIAGAYASHDPLMFSLAD
jgi:hypothetical protein